MDVHFVLLPDSLILDWAGPAEALRIANQVLCAQGGSPAFAMHFVGPQTETSTSVGARMAELSPLPSASQLADAAACQWIVLVGQPGRTMDLDGPPARSVLHWLRGLRLAAGRLELVCICAGAVIAARAGLLAGRRATTHHQHLEELRQAEPGCEVVANRVFVEDGPVYSSAGVTTGVDLMLHRMAARCGEAVVAQVAQTMVVALRRGPHDPELSPFLQHRAHLHAALHRVQDAVAQRPSEAWNVPRMAAVAHVSPRHLTRLFVEHAGIAPLQYLRGLRLASAEAALQSGGNVTQAAAQAGFSSDAQLRRTWKQLGKPQTPSRRRRQSAQAPTQD
ncbi:AraC family transcriptional regulator [Rhodoferax koreense]|uniref:AraC family transcriptional regulator n=1 Tax=Rhodoferax koreensis TaxID=1842727 RepID=A0A1P8K3L9_9BURK|nr:AraC family transcriptional regulator [Rhodoferax koreense]